MAASKSLPRSIEVVIYEGTEDERKVKVSKLPLGRASQLTLSLQRVPQQIKALIQQPEIQELFANVDDETPLAQLAVDLIQYLPHVLSTATDVVIDILAVGTELEREEIEQVGLDEATDLLLAVFTVNDLGRIQANLKNLAGRLGLSLSKIPSLPKATRTNGSKTSSTSSPTPLTVTAGASPKS